MCSTFYFVVHQLATHQPITRPAALRDGDRRQTGVRALDIVVTFGNGITTQAVRDTFNEAAVSHYFTRICFVPFAYEFCFLSHI
jgi:hypothetical protein